jgi:hypothetical protein
MVTASSAGAVAAGRWPSRSDEPELARGAAGASRRSWPCASRKPRTAHHAGASRSVGQRQPGGVAPQKRKQCVERGWTRAGSESDTGPGDRTCRSEWDRNRQQARFSHRRKEARMTSPGAAPFREAWWRRRCIYAATRQLYRWYSPPTRRRAWTTAAAGWCSTDRAPRSVLVDPAVRAVLVIIGPVLAQQAPQVLLVEDDDVVEQLPPYRAHQALGHSVLPGAVVAGPLGSERHGGHRADHRVREMESRSQSRYLERQDASSKEKASRSCWTTQGADGDLVTLQCRIWRRAWPMANQTYSKRTVAVGDHEQVHGDDELSMVPQESEPALAALGSRSPLPQVARDGTLGDLEAELQQLAVDPGSSPSVLAGHPAHRVADLPVDRWATRPAFRPGRHFQ